MHYDPVQTAIQKIAHASTAFQPMGVVIPARLEAEFKASDHFTGKLGSTEKDPHIGWLQGMPVYRSLGRDEIMVF